MLSTNDNTTKFCTTLLVVQAVLRLPLSVLLVFCEPQLGRRLEVGTAPRSELLFELAILAQVARMFHWNLSVALPVFREVCFIASRCLLRDSEVVSVQFFT